MAETVTAAGDTSALDRAVDELRARRDEWVRLSVERRIELLLETRRNLRRLAQAWVDASVQGKSIDPSLPWVGEEWVSGPWALASGINAYVETLTALASGRPLGFRKLDSRGAGQLAVEVFPRTIFDRLLMSGITAEVWMEPGVTRENLPQHMASFYRRVDPAGAVALVLGAGNINSIPPLDALYRLIARGQVVMLKLNPVNGYLEEVLRQVFAPFVSAGYLRIVAGGAEVGAHLTGHTGVDEIHITGSARTHDAIVFGPGPEGEERKRRGEPLLSKPITSELGGVGPVIVVPGPWSEADLRFQAENVVTMKLHNAGCNCVAAQVLVLPREWELRDRFLNEVRELFRELPPRTAYYPGAADRQRAAVQAHPDAVLYSGEVPRTLIAGLDPEAEHETCFTEELFGAVLCETSLPGGDASEFLRAAVTFCNQRLDGTLGATLLVHPSTEQSLGPELDRALADLRYGAIGVNGWNAVNFLLGQATWGAFPGHTLGDIGSGIGVVHNSFLFDAPQKTVARGSFYPFPRSWLHGDPSLLPRPPWFVTNRTAHVTARRVAQFALDPGWQHIPGIFASALQG